MLTRSEAALMRAVLIHGPIARSALTDRLALSPASLTRLAKPFLDLGYLVELDDVVDGSVGRPTKPLDVAQDLGLFAGVKITANRVHVVATDARASVVGRTEIPLLTTDVGTVVAAILQGVADAAPGPIAALGVAVGGSVSAGFVEHEAFLGWHDVPLQELLERELGVPVSLENDVVALAEAERWFGFGRGIDGFSVITIGAGVGYGLVANGEVVRTHEAGIGLGGHIPLSATGPMCPEGHRGCSRAMLTDGAIASHVSAALQRPIGYEEALQLAIEGDLAAVAVFDDSAEALGRFIALAANLTLQPACVLAGEGVRLFTSREERVRAAIAADRDPRANPVAVHVDHTGFTAWARGAAAVAIQAHIAQLSLG